MNKIIKTLVINIAIVIFAVLAIKLLTTFGNNTVSANNYKIQNRSYVKAPQFTAIDQFKIPINYPIIWVRLLS